MSTKGSNGHPQTHVHVVRQVLSCPLCGEDSITTKPTLHAFDYGSGDTSVALQVQVPVHTCGACAFEYLDETAERLKHAAVCEHLGVLSPESIRLIRERGRMTRAAFARLTGLGEASLNRWENGLSIQSHANDRYLRLLAHPEVMSRLRQIAATENSETSSSMPSQRRFRLVHVTPALSKKQKAFRLHRAA